MDNIEQLIMDLNWHNPEDVQRNAMNKLKNVNEEEAILLARQSELCSKFCWHNAALVLKDVGYPRIRLAIPYLLEWFQDMNWPGVSTIQDILKTIDSPVLLPHLKTAAEKAVSERDSVWCYWLVRLFNELNVDASTFLDDNVHDLLIQPNEQEDNG